MTVVDTKLKSFALSPRQLDRIAEICRPYHVRRLSLFGSFLHETADDSSDIDLLVEFEADHTPGLAFFGLQDDLSDLLGRRADLNTAAFLSPLFRNRVSSEAKPIYVAASSIVDN